MIMVANDETDSNVRQINQISSSTTLSVEREKEKGFSSPIMPSKATTLFSDHRLVDSNRREWVDREEERQH